MSLKKILLNPKALKPAVMSTYRTHLKSINLIPDTLVRQSILFKLRLQYKNTNSKPVSPAHLQKSLKLAKTFTDFLNRCRDGDKASIVKLIKLALTTQAANGKYEHPYLRALALNVQFKRLDEKDGEFVRDIVKRCLEVEDEQGLEGYLKDTVGIQTARDMELHPIVLEAVRSKIQKREVYHMYYSTLFQGVISIAGDKHDEVVHLLEKSKFFFLI